MKVHDGQVRNTPFSVAMGLTVNGERDILGIWADNGQEGARLAAGVLRAEEPPR